MERETRHIQPKIKIVIKVSEIVGDMLSGVSDEDILQKYGLTWTLLRKVYIKLYYNRHISSGQLETRLMMRNGADASHIPFVQIEEQDRLYECAECGYVSEIHFSSCPQCYQINLRRLTKLHLLRYAQSAQ